MQRFLLASLTLLPSMVASGQTVFINEIHYDNVGADLGEFVEIAGPTGTDLTGWSIVLYNGLDGMSYSTVSLGGAIPIQQNGYGTVAVTYPANGIQNGAPDGVALVSAGGAVAEFLSYEGTFIAVGGPANGMTSVDIGVAESGSDPLGESLQRRGTGAKGNDFVWSGQVTASAGVVNAGQTFVPPAPPIPLLSARGLAFLTGLLLVAGALASLRWIRSA
jgi:hypothetical protein